MERSDDVIASTRGITYEMQTVRDELRGMREQVAAREAEVVRLREQLDSASTEARHDALTGLANRAVFVEKIEEASARLRRQGEAFFVMMLDLDRFKSVNDTLGHPAGDQLLKDVAKRLRALLRETDVCVPLPTQRAGRILELQLLALHCLCDGVDTLLLGTQEGTP